MAGLDLIANTGSRDDWKRKLAQQMRLIADTDERLKRATQELKPLRDQLKNAKMLALDLMRRNAVKQFVDQDIKIQFQSSLRKRVPGKEEVKTRFKRIFADPAKGEQLFAEIYKPVQVKVDSLKTVRTSRSDDEDSEAGSGSDF